MSGSTNPLIPQGTLNRVRCHIVVPSFTALNITSSYMGRNFATIAFEGPFVEQIGTATGTVNSPEPYVYATVSVGILRTQSLATTWLAQVQSTGIIGDVVVHSDTSAFAAITISNAVVRDYEPGAYDGADPVVRLTLRGVYYPNNTMWNGI